MYVGTRYGMVTLDEIRERPELLFPPADAQSEAPAPTPETNARKTISDLLHGKLNPRTVTDLGDAVIRAKQNGSVGRISTRITR